MRILRSLVLRRDRGKHATAFWSSIEKALREVSSCSLRSVILHIALSKGIKSDPIQANIINLGAGDNKERTHFLCE
jgi:hypothetical protein